MSTNLFFELLQVALGTRENLSRVPSAADWWKLFEESFRQAVTGVLLSGIERLPQEERPPIDLLLEWIGEVQVTEQINKLHQNRARELTAKFLSAEFRSCVLKGVGTGLLYPHPLRRQCGDIDIWVDGHRKDVMAWLRSRCEIGHREWHHVEAMLFEDVSVEVHFYPIWLYNPWYNRRLQRWFKEQKPAQMGEQNNEFCEFNEFGFNCPTAEFNVVYSLVHTFHHLMDEGVGLRHVIDYFYILKSFHIENRSHTGEFKSTVSDSEHKLPSMNHKLSTNKSETMEIIQHLGMERFAEAMMYVLMVACGMASEYLLCKPDEKAGKFLLDEIMLAGNFGHFDTRVVIPEDESFLHRNIRKFRRQLRFLKYYPGEVLCAPFWKTWHWCWRFFH